VQARQGSGVTVLDWRRTGEVALLPHLIAAGDRTLAGPFLALRRAVAAEAVAIACVQATDAELDALQVEADALAAETDAEVLAAGNLAFSRRVVELAGNLPMTLLFNTVARVYAAQPELQGLFLVERPAVRASFGLIVALLRTRDPDTARARVRQVLEVLDVAVVDQLQETP
jgi:DNA-binding FadR family transcriptional regulator